MAGTPDYIEVECQEPTCTGDGLDHRNDRGETLCPSAPRNDAAHCVHWYDGEACCRCGDPALGPCPGGCTDGFVRIPVVITPPLDGEWLEIEP